MVNLLQMARGQVIHDAQVLPTGLTRRIKVWHLANTHSSVTTAWAEAIMISGRGVENTTIVPNS